MTNTKNCTKQFFDVTVKLFSNLFSQFPQHLKRFTEVRFTEVNILENHE